MHRVVVLAVDGVIPFELSLASRIFGTARDTEGRPLYEVITCTPDGGPVATAADFSIAVAHDASVLTTAQTVVIPASEAMTKITGPNALPPALAEALTLIRPETRMVSICLEIGRAHV